MIKEPKKHTKYNEVLTIKQKIGCYVKTVFFSSLVAFVITVLLALHARNEMIENLYQTPEEKSAMNKNIAQMLVDGVDYLDNLTDKKYETCMYVGDIYKTAGDYVKAQYAYEIAVSKENSGSYKASYKLLYVLLEQQKFEKAINLLNHIPDKNEKKLIKFKARSYLTLGDKYYSVSKFLSAAKSYEKANFYYTKFAKRDKQVEKSIKSRIAKAYIGVGDLMVASGMNTDALRYLRKAEHYSPDDFNLQYRIGIVLADADPEAAVRYFEPMLKEAPQNIDYGVYSTALMKAANIADLDNRPTMAKYYRYKIHSIDLFVDRKVIYRNDVDIYIEKPVFKKVLFMYPIKLKYRFVNMSNTMVNNLYADFVLTKDNKPVETISLCVADKKHPFIPGEQDADPVNVNFLKKVYTKRELDAYSVKIYIYKDKKYKTLLCEAKVKL